MKSVKKALSPVVVIVLVLVAVGCASDSSKSSGPTSSTTTTVDANSTTTTTSTTQETKAATPAAAFTGKDFYAVPSPLPSGPPGTLLRYQAMGGNQPGGASRYKVMYLSQSLEGRTIAVTGQALVPKSAAPKGGRRLLTIDHGTSGIADECAPSSMSGASELSLTAPFVKAGYLIAMTDYEGLGTPGRHPYLVGPSEGRSALDAIRAAKELPDAHGGSQLAIAGYSQGGHGALFTNQIAGSYAPELHVVGTFAGAPATELDIILKAGPNLAGAAGFVMMTVGGFQAAYPQAKPSGILTAQGLKVLPLIDKGCVGQVIGAFASMKGLYKPLADWSPVWLKLAAQNTPGHVRTADPILIVHSKQDTTVPATLSHILAVRMCGLHQVVDRVVLNKGQSHVAAAPDAYAMAFTWLQARFAGQPAKATCPVPPD